MNSLGSSSKWPSYDSLTSTSSLLFSESEQTEDETDVFSEGEGDGGTTKSLSSSGDEGITLSGNYLDFPARTDQLHSRSKIDLPERRPDETKHPVPAASPRNATLGSSAATPGDLAFAQKCADLRRFICPLLDLLHGLKTGRFDKGLSSFQQSVAIDRLQRILGILQRPEMGEKYLQNLLQIEMMLKIWFPRVVFKPAVIPSQTTAPRQRPHWRQNQMHMPVKKRKLSWSDSDDCDVPTKQAHYEHTTALDTVSTCLPRSPRRQNVPEEETLEHEFTHSAGTLSSSRPLFSCSRREISLPSPCESHATQDSSVSSSDRRTPSDSP